MINKPIVHLYALCWNEEKIIPFFLRHYNQFVDQFFIYDNESTDNSVHLFLQQPNVIVRSYSSNGQIRDDFYLAIKNHEWKKSRDIADIVIVCDMDEFLYAPEIMHILTKFKTDPFTIIRPTGFDMISANFNFNNNEQITNTVQFGVRKPDFDKLIIFKPNSIVDMNYLAGCHSAKPVGDIQYGDYDVKLLHYKNLTFNYVLERMHIFKTRLSDYNMKYKYGIQYTFDDSEHIKYFLSTLQKSTKII